MRAEHLAIDGSVVTIETDVDLAEGATATGWAIAPALMRAHPFANHPPGFSETVLASVRQSFPDVRFLSEQEYSLKNGSLRVVEVVLPTATGGTRVLTAGAWEGRGGCLTTSLRGNATEQLVEVYDTLNFTDSARGLVIDSPVIANPRSPEVVTEIPDVGLLSVRPATVAELQFIPKSAGAETAHGELFRLKSGSASVAYVSQSAVARIDPGPDARIRAVTSVASSLAVQWTPRAHAL